MIDRSQNPEFINSFLDYSITSLNKSPNSIREYYYDLALFFKYMMQHFKLTNEKDFSKIDYSNFPTDMLKKITEQDILSFISFLAVEHKNKPATRARKISTLRIFFKYLYKKTKYIDVNPAQDLETPKIGKSLPKYLSFEESKQLLDASSNDNNRNKERDYAITTLFLNCGMRLSELVGINIKDIDFGECRLTVVGKGNKERVIYLNKACISALNNYIVVRTGINAKDDSKNSKDALFLSERRERISNRTVQNIIYNELRMAGLDANKYSVHKLRHTAATLMYQYGNVDIRVLQNILGHNSIATTEIYTHLNDEQSRNAIENNPLSDYNVKN